MTDTSANRADSTSPHAQTPDPAMVGPMPAQAPLHADAPVPVRKWAVSTLAATTLAVTSGVTFFLVILSSVATPTMGATRSAHLKWKAGRDAAKESLDQTAGGAARADSLDPQSAPRVPGPENEGVHHA